MKVCGDIIYAEVLTEMPPDDDAKHVFKELPTSNLEALTREREFSYSLPFVRR